ncbi:MAG: 5-formyltetrahydrofolate cyclo-ligase, partial [Alphaproteobacteria bacterium]
RDARAHLLARITARPRARVVAGYLPMRSELDPRPAMAALVARGLAVCVPVIEAPGRPLRFRAWHPGVRLVPGPFGAEVPAQGRLLEPDTLIVPLLAFSGARDRLGYGGGFYDRTLAALRARGAVLAIGLAYGAQRDDSLPVGALDQRLDAVATEAGILG